MAEQNDPELADVMKMLEVEPARPIEPPSPDIPVLREQLAILVSTGKCKEAIGTQLTRSGDSIVRQRGHEGPQKVRGLCWRQDHRSPH